MIIAVLFNPGRSMKYIDAPWFPTYSLSGYVLFSRTTRQPSPLLLLPQPGLSARPRHSQTAIPTQAPACPTRGAQQEEPPFARSGAAHSLLPGPLSPPATRLRLRRWKRRGGRGRLGARALA